MEQQYTIKREVGVQGVGLHTGVRTRLTFKPAAADTGVQFVRVDAPGRIPIEASIANVMETSRLLRRTSLAKGGIEVHTVEHLMAAFAGLGIDNIMVELDNSEVPGLDGSCIEFVNILRQAGIEEQTAVRKHFAIKEPISIEEKDTAITVVPLAQYRISYTLNYNHPFLKTQYVSLEINPENFQSDIASNRTFVLQEEVDELKKMGLGQGADYSNTLVVAKEGVRQNTLRRDDEFVRHKILDLMGDLALVGVPVKGHVIALKSGHSLNIKLVRKICEQKKRYAASGVPSGAVFAGGQELMVEQIMQVLPHRYPFLLVDRVLVLEEGKRAVGIKNVTANEHFFVGHFPARPVMPGVLIIEAMAQLGGVLMLSQSQNSGKIAYFMAADKVKFRKTVVPGDQLVLEVEVVKVRSKTGQVRTTAKVDDKVVAEAELMFALGD